MTTAGKWLIALLIIIGTFIFLLYKGYHIIPIVEVNQTTSFKGNPVTGLKIEMTNPFREAQQVQELFDEQKEEANRLDALRQEGKEIFESKHPEYKDESNKPQ